MKVFPPLCVCVWVLHPTTNVVHFIVISFNRGWKKMRELLLVSSTSCCCFCYHLAFELLLNCIDTQCVLTFAPLRSHTTKRVSLALTLCIRTCTPSRERETIFMTNLQFVVASSVVVVSQQFFIHMRCFVVWASLCINVRTSPFNVKWKMNFFMVWLFSYFLTYSTHFFIHFWLSLCWLHKSWKVIVKFLVSTT
jgi:hypothetical protein